MNERLLRGVETGAKHTLSEWFQILGFKASLDDRDKVFTMNEWAAAASISPRTARELIASGEGPPFVQLSNNRIGIRVLDHREWLAARKRKRAAKEIIGA